MEVDMKWFMAIESEMYHDNAYVYYKSSISVAFTVRFDATEKLHICSAKCGNQMQKSARG